MSRGSSVDLLSWAKHPIHSGLYWWNIRFTGEIAMPKSCVLLAPRHPFGCPHCGDNKRHLGKKSIALSPASRTRPSCPSRYTQIQRKWCKMGLRKPTANTSEKYLCMSCHGNSGRLLTWEACPFGYLYRLRLIPWRFLEESGSDICPVFPSLSQFPIIFSEFVQIYLLFFWILSLFWSL